VEGGPPSCRRARPAGAEKCHVGPLDGADLHEFGGNCYSSPLLSFCAMLSVKPHTKTWKEAGNYNSCLSGVIWAVQLIIFHASACLEKAELVGTSSASSSIASGS
jgi:hypothetical protein